MRDKKFSKIFPFGDKKLTGLSNFIKRRKMIEELKNRLISALAYGRPYYFS
jgi:hypothetical protein